MNAILNEMYIKSKSSKFAFNSNQACPYTMNISIAPLITQCSKPTIDCQLHENNVKITALLSSWSVRFCTLILLLRYLVKERHQKVEVLN